MIGLLKKIFGLGKSNEVKDTNGNTHEPLKFSSSSVNLSNKMTASVPLYVPVVNDPPQRESNTEYKLENDDGNVIRINQGQPKGCPKKIEEFVPIVGITKDNRDVGAVKFILGKERQLELKRQPGNPYDKNAIEVYGHCLHNEKPFTCKLGYVPAEISKRLAKVDIIEATVKVMYCPLNTKSIGIRMDIWTKRSEKKQSNAKPFQNMKIPKDDVDRNLLGIELEKQGLIENAIELYEINIENMFDGNHPYDRLAIIYRKKKLYDDEIRALRKGVEVFEKLKKTSPRQDIEPKLEKFKLRLSKAIELSEKNKEQGV